MKLFSGWVMSAGLVLVAGAANAQMLAPYDAGRSPYAAVSDIDGPYAAMPPDEAPPRAGPMLLPAREVYTVVRENGFSPLGIPQQRGLFYTIAVIDRGGADGWLVIDARDGRIVRMMPVGPDGRQCQRRTDRNNMVRSGRSRRSAPSEAARGRRLRSRGWQAARLRCRSRKRRRCAPASRRRSQPNLLPNRRSRPSRRSHPRQPSLPRRRSHLRRRSQPHRRSNPRRCRSNRPGRKQPRKPRHPRLSKQSPKRR